MEVQADAGTLLDDLLVLNRDLPLGICVLEILSRSPEKVGDLDGSIGQVEPVEIDPRLSHHLVASPRVLGNRHVAPLTGEPRAYYAHLGFVNPCARVAARLTNARGTWKDTARHSVRRGGRGVRRRHAQRRHAQRG